MALGGGTWTSQDKVLPGSYINFVSADKAGITLSDRGVCAIPMELDWGKDGEVIKVNAEDVRNVSYRVFGHDYTDEEMLPIREVFRHARTIMLRQIAVGRVAMS